MNIVDKAPEVSEESNSDKPDTDRSVKEQRTLHVVSALIIIITHHSY